MPHFIIECSANITLQKKPEEINTLVHQLALASNLFAEKDIKVRIKSYDNYLVGGEKQDFIHIFGNIMEGRTSEQKDKLSRSIIAELKLNFPDTPIISINIRDFEKAGYCNKTMI